MDVRRAPIRLAAVPLIALLLLLGGVAVAAARTVDARLTPTLVMQGRVTAAVRVRGEVAGQRITRRWTITGLHCTRRLCLTLRLVRQRGDGRHSRLVLRRVARGTYTGAGRFFVGLRCLGRVHRFGEVVPYRITLRITRATTIQGIPFADRVSATYVNPARQDHTICPLGPSFDSAVYSGAPPSPPSPPAASFTSAVVTAGATAAFVDTSHPGGDGATIVRRDWNFGDPASGSADHAATRTPTHTFSGPGTYTVTLTVTDADGLTASQAQVVLVPGPPNADFSAQASGAPLTVAFTDTSSPGPGGAPVSAWSWNFGDPTSGPADTSSQQDPQHVFSAPGTYTVCLSVTDSAGRRSAAHCAPVQVTG